MRFKAILRIRWATAVVLMCALLCLVMGAVEPPEWGEMPGAPPRDARMLEWQTTEERDTIYRDLNIPSPMVDTSLAMRELDDFLLTPALLVQEAVSDGVILTYPEE